MEKNSLGLQVNKLKPSLLIIIFVKFLWCRPIYNLINGSSWKVLNLLDFITIKHYNTNRGEMKEKMKKEYMRLGFFLPLPPLPKIFWHKKLANFFKRRAKFVKFTLEIHILPKISQFFCGKHLQNLSQKNHYRKTQDLTITLQNNGINNFNAQFLVSKHFDKLPLKFYRTSFFFLVLSSFCAHIKL